MYLKLHDDVMTELISGDIYSAYQHYVLYGRKEDRIFSTINKTQEQTELLLFITPHVVASAEEGITLTKIESEKVPAAVVDKKSKGKQKNE